MTIQIYLNNYERVYCGNTLNMGVIDTRLICKFILSPDKSRIDMISIANLKKENLIIKKIPIHIVIYELSYEDYTLLHEVIILRLAKHIPEDKYANLRNRIATKRIKLYNEHRNSHIQQISR